MGRGSPVGEGYLGSSALAPRAGVAQRSAPWRWLVLGVVVIGLIG